MTHDTLTPFFLAAVCLCACAERGTGEAGSSPEDTSGGSSTATDDTTTSSSTSVSSGTAGTTGGGDSSTSATDTDGDPCTILDACESEATLCGCLMAPDCEEAIDIIVPDDCGATAWEVSGDTTCSLDALAQGSLTTVSYRRGFTISEGCGVVDTYIRILDERRAVIAVRYDATGKGQPPPDPPPTHLTLRPPEYFENCLASSDPEVIAQCFIDPFEGPPVCEEPAC